MGSRPVAARRARAAYHRGAGRGRESGVRPRRTEREATVRVLFADKLADHARTRLAAGGFEVRADGNLKGEALREALAEWDPTVLVVRSTKVEATHVAAGRSLSLVIRAGAGVNTIALDACSRAGVYVANCPGKNAVAVAELTLGLLIGLDRHLADNVADLRAGRWAKGTYSKARGLAGRTFGVIGTGQIGVEVIQRVQAFGMHVVAWSRSLTPERAEELGIRRFDTPEEVARRADVVSIHLALTPATRGMIGASIFEAMRPGGIFLNTSRAEVVDEDALLRALDERGLRAGLDVVSNEPTGSSGAIDHPLARHPRVYGTHHIGASTDQAQEAVADEVVRIIETFRRRGEVPNVVNLADQTSADHVLVVRHLDRVGVLASVLDALRLEDLNIEEMGNTIFAGAEAAIARLQVRGEPSPALLARIADAEHILNVSLLKL